ncbi:hypothetical protein ACIA5D_34180 [Actinoplanes sp. NPDC051513]|uniref:hypothetical protein n=1 Tax=Actinoplanes sp. NPDC051513 TaxID=3363908 RepID=UPI0037B0F3C1
MNRSKFIALRSIGWASSISPQTSQRWASTPGRKPCAGRCRATAYDPRAERRSIRFAVSPARKASPTSSVLSRATAARAASTTSSCPATHGSSNMIPASPCVGHKIGER